METVKNAVNAVGDKISVCNRFLKLKQLNVYIHLFFFLGIN